MSKRFNTGDIVYWCNRTGHKFSVRWGRVDEQFNRSLVYIDYLSPKETRLVDDVPIDEFKSESRYKKLPKGWSYDTELYKITNEPFGEDISIDDVYKADLRNPETVKSLYDKGLLVEKSKIFDGEIDADITKQGYRIVKKSVRWKHNIVSLSINADKLYYTYDEAKKEVDANIAEFKRQSELSEYDWSVEQIDNTLNRCSISDKDKQEYRDWLLELDRVEDIEVRLYSGDIQWKYWKNKKWRNIEV